MPMGNAQVQAGNNKSRYGCFPMRIGFMLEHRLDVDLTLPSGRLLRAGQKLTLNVDDITRKPEAAEHTKWVCRHAGCAGKKWATKRALLADHRPNRELEKAEETHCFYGVAHVPGQDERPEKKGKDNSILEEYQKAKLPTVILLSDEE